MHYDQTIALFWKIIPLQQYFFESKSALGGVKGEKETSKESGAAPPKAKEPSAQEKKSAKATPKLGGVENEKETSAAKQADEPPAAEAKAAKAKARANANANTDPKPAPGVEGEQKAGLFGFGKKKDSNIQNLTGSHCVFF